MSDLRTCFSGRAPCQLVAEERGFTFYAEQTGDTYRWTEDGTKAAHFPTERAAVLVIQRSDFDGGGAAIVPVAGYAPQPRQ